ncbi:MAG: hypothetical protein SOZ84_01205 [Treponema sp.]|nr:hypothetical protein [Treponema sp.]
MERNRFLMESLVLSTNRLITLLEQQKTDQKNIQISTSETLPEWVTLELAVEKKGGGSLSTYKTRLYLQPCCGRNSKRIAGRKCWKREDVLTWIEITDELLPEYAQKWGVTLPPDKMRVKRA